MHTQPQAFNRKMGHLNVLQNKDVPQGGTNANQKPVKIRHQPALVFFISAKIVLPKLMFMWQIPHVMDREYPNRPIVGVGAIIVDSHRVLLVKRGKAPLLGEWSIPGGMLEVGETLRQGAEREALEETGLVVRATELLGVFDRIVRDEGQRTVYHYVLVDFLCQRTSGELCASGDAADVRWFTVADIAELALPEDTRAVIQLGIEKARHAP